MIGVKDYYEILGVPRSATDAEIKKAYRRLARKYHPDVSREADAEVRFKEMKDAYDVLKHPEKRAAYDRYGADWHEPNEFRASPGWGGNFSSRYSNFGGADSFSNLFDSIFGHSQSHGISERFANRHSNPEDVTASFRISLEDAFHGVTRQVTLDIPRVDQYGRQTKQKQTFNLRIPKGVKQGQRIRLGEPGSANRSDKSAIGNLYLRIEIEPHPIFQLDGQDILLILPVTPWEAALGRTVKVPTLGGNVDLKIPSASSSGKKLRLKGRGLPGSPPGDQYVELKIVLPKTINGESRALYEKLERHSKFDPRKNHCG